MNIIIRLLSAFAFSASAFTAVSFMTLAEEVTNAPQQRTLQRICSFDPIADLLPTPQNQPTNSPLSYLAQQGFIQNPDGSWICYVNDPKKESRYYTLFKVQQIDSKVVASSFLENGSLIDRQDDRSLDLFMMLIKNHTNATLGNRQSIRRYLEAFMSLVKQGKVPASRRGYLFDSPSRGFVSYYPLTSGKIQGTAITIDINMLRKN
ncbi:hypothetical protein SD80_001200 [Scytonema tolypothrichoides VB-61278]|nr:hypothetical protein SD80_001200 [Scytonema tolypothrichoides VB-61278]